MPADADIVAGFTAASVTYRKGACLLKTGGPRCPARLGPARRNARQAFVYLAVLIVCVRHPIHSSRAGALGRKCCFRYQPRSVCDRASRHLLRKVGRILTDPSEETGFRRV